MRLFFSALFFIFFSSEAFADSDRWDVRLDTRAQYLYDDNRDLGLGDSDTDHNETLDARLKALYKPGQNTSVFTEIRGAALAGNLVADEDTGQTLRADFLLELREFWVQQQNILLPAVSIKAGRQRFREERGIWWNNNLDAARVAYDTTQFSGFLGLGQNLSGYSTAHHDFDAADKDRLRILSEGSWLLPRGGRFELRGLYEHDASGTEAPGTFICNDARDDEDSRLFWFGGRVIDKNIEGSGFLYRADLIGVTGEEDSTDSVAGPSLSRIIGITRTRTVNAWAFDGEAGYAADVRLHPIFTVGYAYGSGDGTPNDGTDHSFRQSGLQSNTSLNAGASRQTYNYGEALRPELSNLHILTLGTSMQTNFASDLTLRYFRYWRDERDTGLRSDRLAINTSTKDRDIGQAVDLGYNIDISRQLHLTRPGADAISLRTSAGGFRAGKAYGPGEGEYMWRGLAEVQISF